MCLSLAALLVSHLSISRHLPAVPSDRGLTTAFPVTINPPTVPRPRNPVCVPDAGAPPHRALPAEDVVGIGAVLGFDKQMRVVRIMNVIPNSPASQAGLTTGLIIHKVDSVSLTGLRLEECVNLVRGHGGTTVRLELIDPDQEETNSVELTRQKIQVRP